MLPRGEARGELCGDEFLLAVGELLPKAGGGGGVRMGTMKEEERGGGGGGKYLEMNSFGGC